jgi:hypothetical protein
MFSRKCDEFSFDDSSFTIHKAKESTARVVLWKENLLINSFTMETSFCGPTKGPHKDTHFTILMLLDLGRKFCQTLVEFSDLEFAEDYHRRMRGYIREIEYILKGEPIPNDFYDNNPNNKDKEEEGGDTKASSNHAAIR